MPQRHRIVLVVALSVVLASSASVASADVIGNSWFVEGPITIDNPCAPSDGAITIVVRGHLVERAMSDGTIVRHYNFHGGGTSASGTQYVINQTQTWVIATDGSFIREFFIRRVSKGPTENAHIIRVIAGPPPTISSEVTCVG